MAITNLSGEELLKEYLKVKVINEKQGRTPRENTKKLQEKVFDIVKSVIASEQFQNEGHFEITPVDIAQIIDAEEWESLKGKDNAAKRAYKVRVIKDFITTCCEAEGVDHKVVANKGEKTVVFITKKPTKTKK